MILGYILRRLAFLPLTLLLVAFATFIVLRLTGNPVDIFLDINRTPEQVEALTKRLHLDEPIPIQFLIFLGDLLQGDFGESLQFSSSAGTVVWGRVGATLHDAALTYEPETSGALGFGFRIGFLGLLHMEITRDRLEREFDLDLISTAPNVVYGVLMEDGSEVEVTNPSEFPEGKIAEVREPVVKATILSPSDFIGTIMELCQTKRGTLLGMDYLSEDRVEMRYTLPMGEIVFDFFDQLKSRTKGYASLDYERSGEQAADLVKVDVLLQGEPVDAFSAIVHRDAAYSYGVMMAGKLKELIPRQQFEVPIQAAIGARVIARENIRAIRKDVLAKCYGGDISRKRKLLEKQKAGKKRMKNIGTVEVPPEAFVAALSTTQPTDKTKK